MTIINKTIDIILFLFIVTVVCSCKKDSESQKLYDVIMEDFYFPDSPPLVVSIQSPESDSILCCLSSHSLYEMMNIKIVPEDSFKEELFHNISQQKTITVDSILFEKLNRIARVDVDSVMLNLYNHKGINGVLNESLDSFGAIYYTSNTSKERYKKVRYIIYLSFINEIYFYWDDETGGLFVMDSYRKNKQEF